MQRPQISIFWLAMRQGMFLPVLLLMAAGGLFVWATHMSSDTRLLAAEGVESIALINDREQTRGRGFGKRPRYNHYLRFQFDLETGAAYHVRRRTSRMMYDQLQADDVIAIRYVASQPDINRFEGELAFPWRLVINTGACILVIFALVIALAGGLRLCAMRRAARYGARGTARVTSWVDYEEAIGKKRAAPRQKMLWRDDAYDREGQTEAFDEMFDGALPSAFPPGSVITVWHDPSSEQSFWEEELMPGTALRKDKHVNSK